MDRADSAVGKALRAQNQLKTWRFSTGGIGGPLYDEFDDFRYACTGKLPR
jgi:hypothetical protein